MVRLVPEETRPAQDAAVAVWYVTGRVLPGAVPDVVPLRIVMTLNVESGAETSVAVKGADAACRQLRRWLDMLCAAQARVIR